MEPVSEGLSCKFKNMALVCAILVVLIHIVLGELEPGEPLWVFSMLIPEGISRIGVPFFFLASGYFFAGHIGENGWWKREVIKRVRTLLVPFILWNMIYLLFGLVVGIGTALTVGRVFGVSSRIFHEPEPWFLGFNPLYPTTLPVMWYVRTLLLFVLASPAIVWALKRFPWVLILGAWGFSILVAPAPYYEPDITHFLSAEGVTYFSLGIFLRWHPIRVEARKLWVWSVIIAVALLALNVGTSYTGSLLARPVVKLSLPFVMYAVWGLIPEKPWAKGITSFAFPCYVLHIFVLDALHGGLVVLAGALRLSQNAQKELEVWVLLALAVPLTLLLCYALRRCCPKTAGVLFGGR